MHGRTGNLDLVKALQVGSDPVRPEVIVLPQIQDLADYRRRYRSGRVARRSRPISQTGFTMLVKALLPAIESCTRDPEVPACLRNMAMLRFCMLKDSQPPGDEPCLFCFCHLALLSRTT
jgi:hypothetical protein